MKKLYLHLGAHKTASTLFQRKLAIMTPDPAVKVISVHEKDREQYIAFRIAFSRIVNEIEINSYDAQALSQQEENLANLIRSYLDRFMHESILWSDENLLGTPLGHRIGKSEKFSSCLYPVSTSIARAFSMATSHFQVKLMIVTRALSSFIISSYKDWIYKLDMPETLEQFSNKVDLSHCRWEMVIKPWIELFHKENCFVGNFEQFKMSPSQFIEWMWHWANLPSNQVNLSNLPKINSGLNANQIDIALALIPIIDEGAKPITQSYLKQIPPNHDKLVVGENIQRKIAKYKENLEQLNLNSIS